MLDERDAEVIEQAADELRALLPPEGPVLVLGVGNRRVTADALGPRTVQKIFVTMGAGRPPVKGIRPVAAVAPGVSASTGLSLQQLAGALVREVRPTALICVDSLCSSEPQRLGRTLQFSDTGLCPAQPGSSKHLDAARLGLPVIAAGIRELDSVIAHGAALLGAAINRAFAAAVRGSASPSSAGWWDKTPPLLILYGMRPKQKGRGQSMRYELGAGRAICCPLFSSGRKGFSFLRL